METDPSLFPIVSDVDTGVVLLLHDESDAALDFGGQRGAVGCRVEFILDQEIGQAFTTGQVCRDE